jgi:Flp pilus assembly pilin Flp
MKNGRGFSQLLFDARGAVAVEFAVVSVFLSLMFIGMIDFGLGFWQRMLVGDAARAGGEWAMSKGITNYTQAGANSVVSNSTHLSSSLITANAGAPFCGCPSVSGGISSVSCGPPLTTCPTSAGICVTGPPALGCPAAKYVTIASQASYATLFAYPGIASPISLNGTTTVRLN